MSGLHLLLFPFYLFKCYTCPVPPHFLVSFVFHDDIVFVLFNFVCMDPGQLSSRKSHDLSHLTFSHD